MPTDRFINDHKNAWQRLEDLLELLDRSSLRKLHREEVRELGHIYRRTASDLAIARAESRDPRVVNYLNSLVIRAHGRIYRAEAQGGKRLRDFFVREFPETFRRSWRYIALSFAVFWGFALIGYFGTRNDPLFSELTGVPPAFRFRVEQQVHWWEGINEANQIASSGIMTNNIQVAFFAFAFGAFLGVGSLYIVAFNGAQLGAVVALVHRAGYAGDLLSFVVGHGVIELSTIFFAGGAGMMIGFAILMPGDLSRADALKARGMDAIRLVIGCAPVLVVAGIIEGFISPAPIPAAIRISIGVATGIALYSYLILSGRGETATAAGAGYATHPEQTFRGPLPAKHIQTQNASE